MKPSDVWERAKHVTPTRAHMLGEQYMSVVVPDVFIPPMHYPLMLILISRSPRKEVFCVTSEVNTLQGEMMKGVAERQPHLRGEISKADFSTPYLCTLDETGLHTNLGSSHDWLDTEKFTAKALELAAKCIKFSGTPVPLPIKPAPSTERAGGPSMGTPSSGSASTKAGNLDDRREIAPQRSRLNQFQMRAIVIAGLFALGAVLFPPVEEHMVVSTSSRLITSGHAGFRFIGTIGETRTRRYSETINVPLLTLELGAIFAACGIALFIGRDK